jgi:FtsP/CotA-like multicopper oxidase with cupredoxin domain
VSPVIAAVSAASATVVDYVPHHAPFQFYPSTRNPLHLRPSSTFPGPTFEMRRGHGAWIEWVNELPAKHFLPIDRTIHGAEAGVPDVRAVVHVHGAKVPPESDGQSDRWFVPGESSRCYYPNNQDAASLWYHDHTMGINGLNVFAGLMGVYLIRDDEEDALKLPRGAHEIPLLICDRFLDADGQLVYPASDDPRRRGCPKSSATRSWSTGVSFRAPTSNAAGTGFALSTDRTGVSCAWRCRTAAPFRISARIGDCSTRRSRSACSRSRRRSAPTSCSTLPVRAVRRSS